MNTIGRYQLAEKLGQGGMGVVYRAYDPLLERVVAVKLIGSIEADAEVRQRFLREARAAGQLSHKNIVTIYDLGEHEGQPYLAMEFLEGQDLQQRMASAPPLTMAQKVELAIELCEGIEYAHQHGIVHRDIKPANIFITTTGRVKMLDFGLARVLTSELTNSNMMMGTLNYMAPEQVRGERADNRSDIFSTGVVLYELFGGRRAFTGDSFAATLYKILQEIPEPLRNLDASLPPELVEIIERALEKDAALRYQQMGAMVAELAAYRQQVLLQSPSRGRAAEPVWTALDADAATIAAPTPVPRPRSGSNPGPSGRPITAPPSPPTQVIPPPATAPASAPAPARSLGPILGAAGVGALLLALVLVWSMRTDSRGGTASPPAAAAPPSEPQGASPPSTPSASQAKPDAAAPAAAEPPPAAATAAGDRDVVRAASAARARMDQARSAALAAGAPGLASRAFQSALSVQQRATAAERGGRHAEAAASYAEASGLFRGAELAAVAEAATRAERSRGTQPERTPQPAGAPAPAPPPAPVPPPPPVSSGGLPLPTPSQPVPAPPSAPPAEKPVELKPPPVSPTAGINELLERYKGALESRSIDALRRLWPSLGGSQQAAIRDEFQNASRIDVEILNPQISVQGNTATVTFLRRYQLETTDRQRLRRESRTTMQLQRSGPAWVIERMRFEPVR